MAGTPGALKSLIGDMGLGVSVFRDRMPKQLVLPAVVISEAVSVEVDPASAGDFSDPQADVVVNELTSLDLFEAWRNPDGTAGESLSLADTLHRNLHGSTLPQHTKHVYAVLVTARTRILEVDEPDNSKSSDRWSGGNVVHHAYQLLVRRQL